ncbi:MAG: hypothetical protein HW389_173 [Bacteroidetes bacterium]|nr:hypothetical protein [Bacteroidota bacterium]
MQANLFEDSGNLDAPVHRTYKHCSSSCVMDFQRECLCFGRVAAKGFDKLPDDLFKRVNLIVEEDHLRRWLNEDVAFRNMLADSLLVH